MHAEQVTGPDANHGEGPVWITGTGWPDGLYWVDMLAGDVLHLTGDGTVVRRHVSDVVAVIRPRTGGGLVYAIERGFATDDGPDAALQRLPELWADSSVRMNEGGCDPAGNFWCGSMAFGGVPAAGALYVLHPDGSVRVDGTGYSIPNGLAWTASGERAFHVDTSTGRIDALDWSAERGLHDRRPFATIEGGGGPDGLTVDAEGGVWVAVWGGQAVHRYDPAGALSEVVDVPAAQVSACTFGDPGLDRLYITTSRNGLADPEPAAGALFVADVGAVGLPTRPFAG